MKRLLPDQLPNFFASLESEFALRLPVRLPDGTRALGTLADGPLALLGGALPAKPTAAFFPQQELVLTAAAGEYRSPDPVDRPLLVVGFIPRDLACLRFIDRFFATGWRDDLYFRQRSGAVIVGLAGYCGPTGRLLPPAGCDCDLELIWDREQWLMSPCSVTGEELAARVAEEVPASLAAFGGEVGPDPDELLLQQAADLLREERVPNSFWDEIGDRCIACTGCNLACPTCTCFGVQDWRSSDRVERSRMWDSCQLDGFMREAGGHNPLGTEGLRTRRRITHKLTADPDRWGETSCFLCGRCDAVCPTGIGIMAVAREMVQRFGTRC